MHQTRARLLAALVLAGLCASLTGCILPPPPRFGGWCYYHPYRC